MPRLFVRFRIFSCTKPHWTAARRPSRHSCVAISVQAYFQYFTPDLERRLFPPESDSRMIPLGRMPISE